jgi:hypothetical protein
MKLLGKGGSSRVYEAIDAAEKCVVAIKRVDLSDVDEAQAAGHYFCCLIVDTVPVNRNLPDIG